VATKFLDDTGLEALLYKIKAKLAFKNDVKVVKDDTDKYVTEVDYSQIQFSLTESYEEVLAANNSGEDT
jgi:hypothetical protein